MKLRNILLVAASLCITWGGAYAQKKKTFYVPKAGTLVELLTENEANQITHLTLQGKLNAIDFRHLRDEFTNLKVLDISNATISMYTGKNGTYPDRIYVYPGNCIPAYAFCKKLSDGSFQGKQTLERVILSDKTKNIEDAAFKGSQPYLFRWEVRIPIATRKDGKTSLSSKENLQSLPYKLVP